MPEVIESLADLRPGDLMFGPIGGVVGVGVSLGQMLLGEGFRVGRLDIRHVAVVTAAGNRFGPGGSVNANMLPPRITQAMPRGAEEIEIGAERWTPEYAFCRPPYSDFQDHHDDMAEQVVFHAREMVRRRVPYSWASYVALATWKLTGGRVPAALTRWINRRDAGGYPREAMCSVFADQAMSLAGFEVFRDGRPEQCVTPGHLAAELLFRHRGAVWGGASWQGPRVAPLQAAPQ